MEREELREMLERLHDKYNRPEFIEPDPISIPHAFEGRDDREIAGFLAATIAWGNRKMIVRNAFRLMERMDRAPFDFTCNASEQELNRLCDFTHRTFNGGDCIDFIRGLRHICRSYGSLGRFFETEYSANGDLRLVFSRL